MPNKTVKKTTAKTTAAKKTTTKKSVAAKKPIAKKTVKKAVPEIKETVVAPEMPACPCGAGCKCGAGENCACDAECKCARRGGFGRFMLNLIMILIVFALGFGAAKLLDCRDFRGVRPEFKDGCLVEETVKCPQMQQMLPMMDVDGNGCISHDEYRNAKIALHEQHRMQQQIQQQAQ